MKILSFALGESLYSGLRIRRRLLTVEKKCIHERGLEFTIPVAQSLKHPEQRLIDSLALRQSRYMEIMQREGPDRRSAMIFVEYQGRF